MKFSKYFIPTMVNNPADCDNESQRLMLRTGMIKKVSNGLFVYLPNFMRVMRKVTNVIREEMESVNCNECKFPLLVSKETLEASGRWNAYGKEMFKLEDRHGKEFAISPTNEEAGCFMAENFVESYKDMPFAVYQIQQKHRDEIRPRGGVMRAREFIMKDAYSFHASDEDLDKYYEEMKSAYQRVFTRLGLDFALVNADNGAMGGRDSQEFMAICQTGEADIAFCNSCGYGANLETVECPKPEIIENDEKLLEKEEVFTPDCETIQNLSEFFKIDKNKIVKAVIFKADDKFVMALVRGDREVNDVKLNKILKATSLEMATEEEIEKHFNTVVGFIGPTLKNIKIYADYEILNMKNFVCGANKINTHYKNANLKDFEAEFIDLRNAEEGDVCPHCKKPLKITQGNELGHIFKLGKRYTDMLNITFVNNEGKNQTSVMGCYGIGIERTISSIIEQYADEAGIAWPIQLAPFAVNVITVDMKNEQQRKVSEEIYNQFKNAGVEVIWDDRDQRAGFKFKDSELIGIPFNVIVGKNVSNNQVEFQKRLGEKQLVNINEVLNVFNASILSEKLIEKLK